MSALELQSDGRLEGRWGDLERSALGTEAWRMQAGAPIYRVGMYQTVWVRDGRDGVWRILFDGSATTGQPMADRAAAERWVEEQAMSDCAS